jgi:hypothetical protein
MHLNGTVLGEAQGQICLSLSSINALALVYRDAEFSHTSVTGEEMKSVISEHCAGEIFNLILLTTAFIGHKILVLKHRSLSGMGGGTWSI